MGIFSDTGIYRQSRIITIIIIIIIIITIILIIVIIIIIVIRLNPKPRNWRGCGMET